MRVRCAGDCLNRDDRHARRAELVDCTLGAAAPVQVHGCAGGSIFKSHFTPEVLPIKAYPKVKFLAMARNGMDVVNSFYPFFASHRPSFKSR